MIKLTYLGHASFQILTEKGVTLYIDPFALEPGLKEADLILCTHRHYDHADVDSVEKKDNTIIIYGDEMIDGDNYKTVEHLGIKIEACPAYNKRHSKEECVGFILTVEGLTIYHCGDTDLIPEMKNLVGRHFDCLLCPIDGKYTMSPEDADKLGAMLNPDKLIPVHTCPGYKFYIKQAFKIKSDKSYIMIPNESLVLGEKKNEKH